MGTTHEVSARHGEAPVAMSAKVVSPGGIVWMITIRDGADKQKVGAVVQLAKEMESGMIEKGWTPHGGYGHRTSKPNGTAPTQPANGNGNTGAQGKLHNAYLAPDGTPMCAVHGEPLHKSQFKGWYCPRPGSGPRGFCTATFTPES